MNRDRLDDLTAIFLGCVVLAWLTACWLIVNDWNLIP